MRLAWIGPPAQAHYAYTDHTCLASLALLSSLALKLLLNTTQIHQRLSVRRRSVIFKVQIGLLAKFLVSHLKSVMLKPSNITQTQLQVKKNIGQIYSRSKGKRQHPYQDSTSTSNTSNFQELKNIHDCIFYRIFSSDKTWG